MARLKKLREGAMHTFISYMRVNASEVDRLATDLRANGVTVWLDRESIKPGEVWQESIRSAIMTGAYFIACFSTEYDQRDSTYMDEEVAIAMEEMQARAGGSWFLPVRFSACDLSRKNGTNWPALLSSLQWVDLRDNWDRGVRQILEVVSGGGPSHHYLRSAPKAEGDPYAGIANHALLVEVDRLTNQAEALNIAKRHEEAADFCAGAMRIWESVEAHRLDSVDRNNFLINSFKTHYSLALLLYKSNQRLRASNETVKAAKRYGALLRQGEATIGRDVWEAAEGYAEVLMSIGREIMNATPESQKIEGLRVYVAIMNELADANPLSFRRDQGIALAALAQAAREKNLPREADRSISRAVDTLREALQMQGDVILRDIGQVVRTAIDSYGHEHLRAEYDELVEREVDYINRSGSIRALFPAKASGRKQSFWKKFRISIAVRAIQTICSWR